MRIKNFTLMLMAVLFSVAGYAQKSFAPRNDIAFNRQTAVKTLVKQNSISAIAVNQPSTPSRSAKAPAKAPEVVTPPEKGDVEYYTLTGSATYGNTTTDVSLQVKVVWDDEDEDVVYISGLSYYMPSSFVKGTFNKEGDKVIFASGQYMGNLEGVDLYFGGYGDGTALTDVVADFNEKESSFTFSDVILDNGDPSKIGFYAYMRNVTIVPLDGEPEIPVEIPKDLEIEKYAYTAIDNFSGNVEVSGNLNVGFYGDDVYIQGMSTHFPEAWIKGKFVDDKTVSFPSGQLLTDEEELYFISVNDNFDIAEEYTLIYDEENGSFEEGDYAPMINTYKDKIDRSVWQFYYGYEIKPITENAAVPGKSSVTAMNYKVSGDDVLEFALTKVDVDGNGLVEAKLAYKLWYVTAEGDTLAAKFTMSDYPSLTEDMDEMPATFTDGTYIKSGELAINMKEHTTWKSLGIQCIYYGGEERNEGEIAWYTPTWPFTVTLPEGLTVTDHVFTGTNNRSGATISKVVGVAFDGDDMYIRGLGSIDETAWVKGTKDSNGDYIFPAGQYLGNYNDKDLLFFIGYTDEKPSSAVLTVDAANGEYVFTTEFFENADYTDKVYYVLNIASGATIEMAEAQPEVPTVVEVPEGLQTESWIFSGTGYFDSKQVARSVKVGFDGDDVYVQGVSAEVPDAWIKGTLDGDQVTFKTGQFLAGADSLFFIGFTNGTGISNYVMTYDEEAGRFTNDNVNAFMGVNADKDNAQSLYELYYSTKIAKIVEQVATPTVPSVTRIGFTPYGDVAEFNIPLIDTNNEGLVDSLVSYKLYYDEGDGEAKEITFTTDLYTKLTEDMTVIPYGFLDYVDAEGNAGSYDFGAAFVYLNMDYSTWKRVGIQSIYVGGGETNASEIGWYTIIRPTVTELPEGAVATTYSFVGTDSDGEFTRSVKVAKVGDDVYVQGIGTISETSWVKGTKNASTGVYTFAKGQTLGQFRGSSFAYNIYLMGYNSNFGAMDVMMSYDEENDIFTTTNILVENANYVDNLYSYNRISAGAVIKPASRPDAIDTVEAADDEKAATFNIAGQRVANDYKGLVIKNGKKYLVK